VHDKNRAVPPDDLYHILTVIASVGRHVDEATGIAILEPDINFVEAEYLGVSESRVTTAEPLDMAL